MKTKRDGIQRKEVKIREVKKREKITLKRIWDFLWKSDSPWSWILDFILAFVIVRFVFFPFLGLVLSTSLPLVVIESGSMEHKGDFEAWWQDHGEWYVENNLTKENFLEWSFKNGLDKGDIVAVKGMENYQPGDIIIFKTSFQRTPIIHRIIYADSIFQTKGDNNPSQSMYEKEIQSDQIIGKAIFRIPKLGWIKLIFVELFRFFF